MSTPSDIARYDIDPHESRIVAASRIEPCDGGHKIFDAEGKESHWLCGEIFISRTDHIAARAADAKRIEQLEVLLAESGMGRKAVQIALQLWRERDEAKEQVRRLTAGITAKAEAAAKEITGSQWQKDEEEVTATITRIFTQEARP